MSPNTLPLLRGSLRRGVLPLFLALGALVAASTPASAAVQTFTATDPAGDTTGTSNIDVLKLTATYDGTAGTASVSVETASSVLGKPYIFAVSFFGDGGPTCEPPEDAVTSPPGISIGVSSGDPTGQLNFSAWSVTGTDAFGDVAAKSTGTTFTATTTTDPALKGLSLSCVRVEVTGIINSNGEPLADPSDVALAFPVAAGDGGGSGSGGGGGSPPTIPLTPPPPVFTTEPDVDRDGTPDTADGCPTVAGASKNGCPTIPVTLGVRLGAKRVAVDTLVKRVSAICPASVIAVVTAKGKRIGRARLAVSTFGQYCRVNGVVPLKKHASKVRITARTAGMYSLVKSLKH